MSALIFLLGAIWLSEVAAVNHGVEQYGNSPGHFYVFNSTMTQIVEPSTGKIVKSISFGVPNYGDALYAEDQAQLKHYLFVAQSVNNKVTIFDTDAKAVLATATAGKRPLHMFSIYYRDEVWIHLDMEGSFDIFDLANARYRSSSSVKDAATRNGHGKLMFHPAMQSMAFATNVNETGVQYLNIETRKFLQKVPIFNAKYKCAGTHGVEYSPVNNKIYAECSNPSKCVKPFKNATLCTGSLWTVNAATATSDSRLVSPTLSASLGPNFGVQGQPYHSPDNTFLFVPNKNLDILHILQPTSTTTNIVEVVLTSPGNIVFYPKNPDILYGTDKDPSNYIMAIGCAEGVAFLEMSVVVDAFQKGVKTLSLSDFTIVATVTGGVSRTITRGYEYVVVPEYTGAVTNRLAVVSFKTKKIQSYIYTPNSLKVAFVPADAGQLKAQVAALTTLMSSSSMSQSHAHGDGDGSSTASILAVIAIVLSVITLTVVLLLFAARNKDLRRHEMESRSKTYNVDM